MYFFILFCCYLNLAEAAASKKKVIETKIIQADFSSRDESVYTNIQQKLKDLDIGLLGAWYYVLNSLIITAMYH